MNYSSESPIDKAKAILNELTLEKFDQLNTKLCAALSSRIKDDGTFNFKKLLLNQCQIQFERASMAEVAQQQKQKEDEQDKDAKAVEEKAKVAKMSSTELKAYEFSLREGEREAVLTIARTKRHVLGFFTFFGELYKEDMIPDKIMYYCINVLFDNAKGDSLDANLEQLCKLLDTAGDKLEKRTKIKRKNKAEAKKAIDTWEEVFEKLRNHMKTAKNSRIRFVIQDVLDLRSRNWVARIENKGSSDDSFHCDFAALDISDDTSSEISFAELEDYVDNYDPIENASTYDQLIERLHPEDENGYRSCRRPSSNDLTPFLEPKFDQKPVSLAPKTDSSTYLTTVKANNLAEYAAFLDRVSINESSLLYGKRMKTDSGEEILAFAEMCDCRGKQVKMNDKHNHLLLIKGNLCIASCRPPSDEEKKKGEEKPLTYIEGTEFAPKFKQNSRNIVAPVLSGYDVSLYDLGFVGEFIDEYGACNWVEEQLLSATPPRLLEVVADPSKRKPCPRSATIPQSILANVNDPDAVPINESQFKIVRSLSNQIECVQGPPGTGKSTTIFHIINSCLDQDEIALATCVQNKAVDAIAEKIANRVPFVVVGNKDRLSLVAKMWTLEEQVNRDSFVVEHEIDVSKMKKVFRLVSRIIEEKEQSGLNSETHLERRKRQGQAKFSKRHEDVDKVEHYVHADPWRIMWKSHLEKRYPDLYRLRKQMFNDIHRTKELLKKLRKRAQERIIIGARAILCTVASTNYAWNMLGPFLVRRVRTVILDEAGTAPERKLPILLTFPCLERIIAIGDQKQLAPFTNIQSHGSKGICFSYRKTGFCRFGLRCKFEHQKGMDDEGETPTDALTGYFQRVEQALVTIPMLLQQYRMHPKLSTVVSDLFYEGQLTTPHAVANQRLETDEVGIWKVPICDGTETEPNRGKSKANSDEVDAVFELVTTARKTILRNEKSLMVITFYKAQEHALRERFEKPDGIKESPTFRICTVDQSQGSEADVVVLSTVRSNSKGNYGFVGNVNRMNVAISRARERLVLVGNPNTFASNLKWTKVWNACTKMKVGRPFQRSRSIIDHACEFD